MTHPSLSGAITGIAPEPTPDVMPERNQESDQNDSHASRTRADQGTRERGNEGTDRGNGSLSPSIPTSSNAPSEPATVDDGSSILVGAASPAPGVRPTAELLAEARRLADAATEGPWRVGHPHNIVVVQGRYGSMPIASPEAVGNKHNDASFIAAARTLVPELAGRVAALTAAVERVIGLDVLFDVLFEAEYGSVAGAEERESIAQLAEAVQPLLRAALVGRAS